MTEGFSRSDYPPLYQETDELSARFQRQHLSSLGAYLMLLGLASVTTTYTNDSIALATISAIVIVSTLVLTGFIALGNRNRLWYLSRAVAESIKTISWRFMMRAEPYFACSSIDQARHQFVDDIKAILNANQTVSSKLGAHFDSHSAVSAKMAEIYSRTTDQRFAFYEKHRIENQLDWYKRKARIAGCKSKAWFSGMIGLQVAAIALFVIETSSARELQLPTGTLITLAAGVLTWIQVKRFQELAAAYSLTAHEIILLRRNETEIQSDEDLSDFVKDAENAFSREHTQWAARSDAGAG